jgi:hypothetical protein
MTRTTVFLAPVPASILESAQRVPDLAKLVAFGSNKPDLKSFPMGLGVYIYVSQPPHRLCKPGYITWGGKLGAIVPAVEKGRRSGKHPNPAVRPPFAESDDTPATLFWEVLGLHLLDKPIPFSLFENVHGGKPFSGGAPEWPTLAVLNTQ